MKAVFVKDTSKVFVNNIENQSVGNGDLLVRMQACGICGSDVEKVFGQYGQPSMRLGHEPSGIIARIGKNVTDFKIGDRVFVHHHVPCYSCHYCNHGNETMCEKYYETNLSPCGLAEQFIVPEWNVKHGGVIKIPESMKFEEAAMIEPLACCIRAWKKTSFQKGDSVAIFGIGSTGMMHVMLSQMYKFKKIFCFDMNDFRLNFAKQFGVTNTIKPTDVNANKIISNATNDRGVDIAIIATGNLQALIDSVNFVRKGGTIMLFGVPSKNATVDLDLSKIYSKEITLITSYAASDNDTNEALKLISSSEIDVGKLITHRYSLLDSQKAFDHAHTGENAMKIIITN